VDLITALKSKKRIRNVGVGWFLPDETMNTFSIDMILRDDWEIEEPKKELSESEIRDAYSRACVHRVDDQGQDMSYSFIKIFLKQLGF
jgi:hypothetical protein